MIQVMLAAMSDDRYRDLHTRASTRNENRSTRMASNIGSSPGSNTILSLIRTRSTMSTMSTKRTASELRSRLETNLSALTEMIDNIEDFETSTTGTFKDFANELLDLLTGREEDALQKSLEHLECYFKMLAARAEGLAEMAEKWGREVLYKSSGTQ